LFWFHAGTFNEDVIVTSGIKLLGQGYANTTLVGQIGGEGATIRVSSPNVIIDGFAITRAGNNPYRLEQCRSQLRRYSDTGSNSFAEIRNCSLYGNRTGIDVNNSNGNNIHNNLIDNNRTGLIFRNQTDYTTVEENFITNNWTIGVLFLDGSNTLGSNVPVQTAINSNFSNNNISGNWYGDIQDRQSGGSIPAPGVIMKDFDCNWFGTTAPVVTAINSTEPGYGGLIPVAYGGTAVPPGGQPNILGTASANLDYVSYLTNGSDNNGSLIGFQPAPGACGGTPVEIISAFPDPITCGESTGSILVTWNGGAENYDLTWTGGGFANDITGNTYTITNLPVGTVTITLTEANGTSDATVVDILYLPVANTTDGLYFATIQEAIDATTTGDGDVIEVCAGTYTERPIVDKGITIKGAGITTIVKSTSAPASGVTPTVFKVTSPNVTLRDMQIEVDFAYNHSAIHTSGNDLTGLQILNNKIISMGTAAYSYGLRNAIGVNPNISGIAGYTLDNDGFSGVKVEGNTITYSGTSFFRAGIQMDLCGGIINNNNITSVNHDFVSRFANQGTIDITGNQFYGGGAQIGSFNGGAGLVTISGNTFDNSIMQPASGNLGTGASLRLIYYGEVAGASNNVIVDGNTFKEHRWGVSVENFKNVTFNSNTFTPKTGSTDFVHISFNTKMIASTSASSTIIMWPVGATLTNNNFNASGTMGGSALAFYNHRGSDAVFGTYTLGTAGNENTFNDGFANYILLDNSTGASTGWTQFGGYGSTPSTTMAPWSLNMNASNNYFAASTPTLPSAMILSKLFSLEDKIQHKIDASTLGFVTVVPNNNYVTINSFVSPNTTPLIQRGIDAASAGNIVNVNTGNYNEKLLINKGLTLEGVDGAVLDGTGLGPVTGVSIKSGDVTFNNIDVTNFGGNGIICGYESNPPGGLQNIHITNCVVSNIQPGSSHGFGIYAGYQSEGFPGTITAHLDYSGLVISGNEIHNTANAALVLQSITSSTGSLLVSDNHIHNSNASGIWIDCARELLITSNEINSNSNGIYMSSGGNWFQVDGAFGPKDIDISNNRIYSNSANGVVFYAGWPSTISINDNSITTNGTGINNQISNSSPLDASCNWFGTENASAIAAKITGSVQFLPFLRVDNTYGNPYWWSTDKYSCIGVGPVVVYNQDPLLPGTNIIGSHMTIQAAIDASTTLPGHYIAVSSGNYDELVNVHKGVTISGHGADNTLLQKLTPSAGANFITISASNVAIKDIAIVGPTGVSTTRGIYINGTYSTITVENVISNQHNYGILADASSVITGLTLTNTTLNVNGNGLEIAAGAKIDGLTINGGEMNGNSFGLSAAAHNTMDNSNDLKNVTITNTTFANNGVFGLLFNKGQAMTLTGLTVTGNGNASTFSVGAGIYFTWRQGTYSGITVTNSTISGNRTIGTDNGGGIWVRPRAGASVSGVSITNNLISNNGSAANAATAGILVLKNNNDAGTDPGIVINGNSITGNANFGITSTTTADIDATCNWFGTTTASAVAALVQGKVDFSPWLTSEAGPCDLDAPILTVTGFTADGDDMSGSITAGYTLNTTNVPTLDRLVQFKTGTAANETLAAEYFGLKLLSSTVSKTALKEYYDLRGIPEPYLSYLKDAADGLNPFVYINGTTVKLVDAAKHDIASADVDMTIPDNYPLGTYTVEGKIRDLAGNETTVTYILKVEGDRVPPVITLLGTTPVKICKGETYTDAGATALDDVNGDITSYIVPTSTVNTNVPGSYTVTYNVNDAAGNAAVPVTRTVIVNPLPTATITAVGEPSVCSGGSVTLSWLSQVLDHGILPTQMVQLRKL
jgi:nitrous oxidase accessory protein NosD